MIICPCASTQEASEEIDDELLGSGGGDEDSVELPQEIQIDQQVTGDPISEED